MRPGPFTGPDLIPRCSLSSVSYLFAHDKSIRSHIAEALVLGGDQDHDKANQVREGERVYDAQHGPYSRGAETGHLAVVSPHHLYAKQHLANRLPTVALEEAK